MIKKVRIPKKKIGLLSKVKERIEKSAKVTLKINKEVTISGEPLDVLTAEKIVLALGRGFKIDDALLLLDEEYTLHILPIAKKRNDLVRLKGRLIGREGKIKRRIEKITGVKISVSGKTVSIIGKIEDVDLATAAIQMILEGRKFATVFRFLERMKRAF